MTFKRKGRVNCPCDNINDLEVTLIIENKFHCTQIGTCLEHDLVCIPQCPCDTTKCCNPAGQ